MVYFSIVFVRLESRKLDTPKLLVIEFPIDKEGYSLRKLVSTYYPHYNSLVDSLGLDLGKYGFADAQGMTYRNLKENCSPLGNDPNHPVIFTDGNYFYVIIMSYIF